MTRGQGDTATQGHGDTANALRMRLLLAAILLVAFGLRVYRLGVQSLWYDEAVTAQVAGQGLAELTRWTAGDIQPPLYYYGVAGWTRLAGQSEWSLRFLSAFFGALAVPLMWAVARRLFGRGRAGRWAAGTAATLAAISPLYVYYAQEARMYTLLTCLGLLAGYALLRAMADDRQWATGHRLSPIVHRPSSAQWWLVFVLASVAMLYTHYFGAFLQAAYGVCFLVGWPADARRGRLRSRLPGAFALAAVMIVLLYLPWLPAMLTRYHIDRSYWQGALKLNEALRHVAISFTTGAPDTMLERDALRLLPWFGFALAIAVVALVWTGSTRRRGAREGAGGYGLRSLGYLSACLLIPTFAILLLSSRSPKFNPRYLMMASPAYLLILAGGVGALGGARGDTEASRAARSTLRALRVTLALLLVAFMIGTSFLALCNWFADPAFTKAQWRELTASVRAQAAPDEAVLLVSGHASPAWDYYASDIPRARLPDIDVLDVDMRLGFDVGGELAVALAGASGAWLVAWQDEVVDPVGFVPFLLDRAGSEQPVSQRFWHLGLRHWMLAAGATFPAAAQPAHAQGANFDHKLALLGWDDPQGEQITVYWRALNTPPGDYKVSLVLEDAAGREVGRWDGRPAGYGYPTTRWRPGEELFGRYPLPLPISAAAGDYTATLAVYDEANPSGLDIRDVADNPAGKRVRLGPMPIR